MLTDFTLDMFKTLTSINGHKVGAIVSGSNGSKQVADALLELLLLITLLAPTTSLCGILGRYVEE
jgi:hypothetical protein